MKFGIDRLLSEPALRADLNGRRVALLGHPASVTADLTHSLDALMACPDLSVTAAFGPQHGMRGDLQDNMMESPDFTDPRHGIPVFSLYGEVRRPTGQAMGTFDVLLVDIAGATPEGDGVDDLTGNALSYELGTEGMLPGFDEAVRGAKAGESRSFEFTPQNGDWVGIPLTVTATVSGVRERELPELNDDFAQMASEFDTVAELQDDVKTRLVRLKRLEQGAEARNKVHEVLIESLDIPLPEGVITAEVEAHFEDGHDSGDEHRAEVEQQAREALKSQFILDKIAEQEEVSVGETELSAWLVQQAPRYGMSPDQFAQALVEAGQVPMAIQDIRRAKALAVVLESATVVDADGNAVDLKALDAELNGVLAAE
jgi:trigger factor